jgi:hypothetical protein
MPGLWSMVRHARSRPGRPAHPRQRD